MSNLASFSPSQFLRFTPSPKNQTQEKPISKETIQNKIRSVLDANYIMRAAFILWLNDSRQNYQKDKDPYWIDKSVSEFRTLAIFASLPDNILSNPDFMAAIREKCEDVIKGRKNAWE